MRLNGYTAVNMHGINLIPDKHNEICNAELFQDLNELVQGNRFGIAYNFTFKGLNASAMPINAVLDADAILCVMANTHITVMQTPKAVKIKK